MDAPQTGAHLAPVLDTLRYLHHETPIWLEITSLQIERDGHRILAYRPDASTACSGCGRGLAGRFGKFATPFGARRVPVHIGSHQAPPQPCRARQCMRL